MRVFAIEDRTVIGREPYLLSIPNNERTWLNVLNCLRSLALIYGTCEFVATEIRA